MQEFVGHPGGMLALAFAPDGRVLATGGKDRMVRLWEVAAGKERRVFGGNPGWVSGLAFTPDGRSLATGHTDGAVCLWDAVTGRLLHEFAGHRGGVTGLGFAAGQTLVSAGRDGTALVWDVGGLPRAGKIQTVKLSDRELEGLWGRLAGADVPAASLALQTLARAPAQTVPLLRQRVGPVSAEKIARLLADLDDESFPVRDRAMKELERYGKFAEPALRQALKRKPSIEVHRRIEALLDNLSRPQAASESLRALRAVEVLEMIGTREARQVLEAVAKGAPEAELTRQAKAALERLGQGK
jgi:hypothetical protein